LSTFNDNNRELHSLVRNTKRLSYIQYHLMKLCANARTSFKIKYRMRMAAIWRYCMNVLELLF